MNKHNTLVLGNQRKIQISQAVTERHQSSRKRIRQFRQSHPSRRGRGTWRGEMRRWACNPRSMTRNFRENFKAEAKIYSKNEYNNLTPTQKSQIHKLKLKTGWLNGRTPPSGFQINPHTGRIEPNTQMVSTIGAATSNSSYDNHAINQSRVGFASPWYAIGESMNGVSGDGGSTQLGTSFGRSERCQLSSSNSTISSVVVNGRSYHGPLFDEKGNKLNWLLIRLGLLLSGLGQTVLKFIYYMFNSILKKDIHTPSDKISIVRTISGFSTVSSSNNFKYPKLSKEDLKDGCKLGWDTLADTDCSG